MNSFFDMQQKNMRFGMDLFKQGMDYWIDFTQRSILFADVIRKRGNGYLDHLEKGQPPVLAFDFEMISDGRNMDRPVNFQLVRILDRRQSKGAKALDQDRRTMTVKTPKKGHDPFKRPIVVIDPRAGHGPGIGGSKLDSQVGVALANGHPVYFILFLVEPMPGQTIADVEQCQVGFLELVAGKHPKAPKPAVIGNCQAGWAAALIGADRPDVTGPIVLNGSPLSYWGGVKGSNPMRYRGGLYGGSWMASLGSDLGNGLFDGADLVAGFEKLNPANTLWTKYYNLFSKIDTEEQRYLDFEKWWGGFFLMTREEIRFIVNHLFISDELEQGYLKLRQGKSISLKNFKDPIVVFASRGDNITPPQQALNWITKVYKDVDEIKQYGQVIVYLMHDKIGHLGIFVSSAVNKKEHKGIIGSVNAIEFLSPGLYEMIIKEQETNDSSNEQVVEFVERDMNDILAYDDGTEDEEAFHAVRAVSAFNDKLYNDLLSPWVRMFSNSFTADAVRQSHKLRVERYAFSDKNFFIRPIGSWAEQTKKVRKPADPDNLFLKGEKVVSEWMKTGLTCYGTCRDLFYEYLFYRIYGNEYSKALFCTDDAASPVRSETAVLQQASEKLKEMEAKLWNDAMTRGGFSEAIIRIILAVNRSNHVFDLRQISAAEEIMKEDRRLKKITADELKDLVKEQSVLLERDTGKALEALKTMLPEKTDRIEAVLVANAIANANDKLDPHEIALLKEIEQMLLPEEFVNKK